MTSHNYDLKALGLKITQPRLKILHVFEHSKQRHLAAEDVYKLLQKQGEDVGIATVYRVLNQFEASGLLSRLNFGAEQAVYELNDGEHHDHVICVRCHKVEEFYDEVIESRQREITLARGDNMVDHSLYIYVECKNCRQKN